VACSTCDFCAVCNALFLVYDYSYYLLVSFSFVRTVFKYSEPYCIQADCVCVSVWLFCVLIFRN
jgi:hypothetical protein